MPRSRAQPPYDGTVLLADTSAWIEVRKQETPPAAKVRWRAALENRQILISPVVRLELYKGARSTADLARIDQRLQQADEALPLAPAVMDLAVQVVRDMATPGGSGYHQVPVTDLLMRLSRSS